MRVLSLALILVVLACTAAIADELPVREVTVFKDGHAFVLRKGAVAVGDAGHVTLESLPAPVLGTFWPFADQPGATLSAVKAGKVQVEVERTALQLRELLAGNVGASVLVTDVKDRAFRARIVGLPTRSSEELAATSPPGTDARLPEQGGLILLETDEGLKAMPLADVREVVFRDEARRTVTTEELRHRLTLQLDWKGEAEPQARVGMLYLQKGLRWIPSYRVDLLADGKARVRLQGTLVNDLVDLENTGVNLVIGVPTFAFADMVDPISMQQVVARVARQMPRQAITSQFLSNAIMTQAGAGEAFQGGAAASAEDEAAGARNEDLYVFHLAGVTLARGERMVVPVADVTLAYEDVYTLNLPFSPPPDAWPQIAHQMQRNNPQDAQAARLLAAPKVQHVVRLENESAHPLTTAPALVLRDGMVLAQGMLTYTSAGGKVDLPVTAAVDVKATKSDREIERAPAAVRWRRNEYARIDMEGAIRLTNFKQESIRLEVTRFVLGTDPEADQDGEVRLVNALEDSSWANWRPPVWWRWYSWPHWWYHFNGAAEIHWDLELEPGASASLDYTWSYYWQ